MKRKPLKEVIQKVLDDRKKILREEAEFYEDQARANSSYWGYGGPVGRQEKAAEKRRAEIEEVNQLEQQLRRSVNLKSIRVYSWYCVKCGAVTMTTRYPEDRRGWHECGCCRRMINDISIQDFEIETPEDRYFGTLMRRLKEEKEAST